MISQQLKMEATAELNRIFDFWSRLRDDRGGFFGGVEYDLRVQKDALKGGILNSRILWFYSNVYLTTGNREALALARHAYEFLRDFFVDKEYGGVYWMLNGDGTPAETMKHTYNQSFAVYGLSAYYGACGDIDALALAKEQYRIIKERCTDEYGYCEAFDRGWAPTVNDKLSEDGYHADKTMNTLLHIIESYTELFRVSKDGEVAESLRRALSLCLQKVYARDERMLYVFFDREMRSIADIYSYGHDIEATWLLDRACDVLGEAPGDEALIRDVSAMNAVIAGHVLSEAFDNGALNYQRLRGEADTIRVWWVQAEGVVGFLNAYQRSGEKDYLDTALLLWEYIKKCVTDKRPGGEWYWCLDYDGRPIEGRPVVEPWKCPYHNGRMCMEVIKRCEKL